MLDDWWTMRLVGLVVVSAVIFGVVASYTKAKRLRQRSVQEVLWSKLLGKSKT